MSTAEAVRSAAITLQLSGEDLDLARSSLSTRAAGWRGVAADAAADRTEVLLDHGWRLAGAYAAAADVLQVCAAQLADAEHLRRRAAELSRHHEDPELLAASQRLGQEAEAATELAVRRAADALRELRPPAPAPRGQVAGFVHALWGQVRDAAQTGWNLDPSFIALHPHAWWSTLSEQAAGTVQAAQHPLQAASAALGLDQLRHKAYGEWAGTMLGGAVTSFGTGGGGRIAEVVHDLDRGALLVAADGRWAVRHELLAGGDVRPPADVALPGGFPRRIKDLTPRRVKHILVGDKPNSGGHRSGIGRPGKTEFPPWWSDDDIIRRVMQTATHPDEVALGNWDNFQLSRRIDGLTVRVVVSPKGDVLTAYPLPGGRGVVDNPRSPKDG